MFRWLFFLLSLILCLLDGYAYEDVVPLATVDCSSLINPQATFITANSYILLSCAAQLHIPTVYINTSFVVTNPISINGSHMEIIGIRLPVLRLTTSSTAFVIEASNVTIININFNSNPFMQVNEYFGGFISILYSRVLVDDCRFVGGTSACGGSIYALESNLTITSSVFRNSSALSSSGSCVGGGSIHTNGGFLNIKSSNFRFNNAYSGGSIRIINAQSVDMTTSVFFLNSASANGGAVSIANTASINVNSSEFSRNKATLEGGALSLSRIFEVTTLSNNVFVNNTAGGGGALSSDSSTIALNCFFMSNKAKYGGALALSNSSFSVLSSRILDNSAESYGGGIVCERNCTLTIVDYSEISSNVAVSSGGALYFETNSSLFVSESTFFNNICISSESRGGFLYAGYAKVFIDSCIIRNSTAASGSHILSVSKSYISIKNSNFEYGDATLAYGIYSGEFTSLIIENSIFNLNKAVQVGAGVGCLKTEVCNISSSSFLSNRAVANAGALYFIKARGYVISSHFQDNWADSGGAAFLDSSEVDFRNCSFNSNKAGNAGGVASMQFEAQINIYGSSFSKNEADLGGCFGGLTCSVFVYDSFFDANIAQEQGGILNIGNNALVEFKDTTIQNSYSPFGGAIALQGFSVLSFTNIRAISNTAPSGGGFLAVFAFVNVSITDSFFFCNNGSSGGVIYSQFDTRIFIYNSKFIKNNGFDFGGVFFINEQVVVTIVDSEFSQNSAFLQGGVMSVNSASINLVNSVFLENKSLYGNVFYLIQSRLYITDSQFIGNGFLTLSGGVAYITSETLIDSKGSIYEDNTAAQGAIFYLFLDCELISMQDTFENNRALIGGVLISQVINRINFTSAIVVNNTAVKSYGSFAYVQTGIVNIFSSLIKDNNGEFGALSLFQCNGIVSGTTFIENISKTNGGAIFFSKLTDTDVSSAIRTILPSYILDYTIEDCVFERNTAVEKGGAIYSNQYEGQVISISNTSFVDNIANLGGAIYTAQTHMNISNSSFSSNRATTGGGAIFWEYSPEYIIRTNQSITHYDNEALFGNFTATNPISLSSSRSNIISQSGQSVPTFEVYLYDFYNQNVLNTSAFFTSNSYVFARAANKGASSVGGSTISQVLNGAAMFNDLVIYDNPGDVVRVEFNFTGGFSVSPTTVDISLKQCVPGQIKQQALTAYICFNCTLNTYSFSPDDSSCSLCPENAFCPGLNTISVKSGFWRLSPTSSTILQCPYPNSCNGGSNVATQCAIGTQGPLCDVCSPGYAANSNGGCTKCTNTGDTVTIALTPTLFFMILVIIIVVVIYRQKIYDFFKFVTVFVNLATKSLKFRTLRVKFKILLAFYQIGIQVGPATNVNFPQVYTKYLDAFSFLNFNLFNFSSIRCLFSPSFYDELLFSVFIPYIVVIILCILICLRAIIAKRLNDKNPSYTWKTAIANMYSVALYVSYIALIPASTKIFEIFSCQTFDDNSQYLFADYSVSCQTPEYYQYQIFGAIMLFFYPIGIPLIYTYLLVKNRKHVNPSWRLVVEGKEKKVISEKVLQREKLKIRNTYDDIKNISFLFDNYKPKRWYFEIFDGFRRLTLGAIPVLILRGESTQIVIVLLVSLLSVAVLMQTKPYIHDSDNRLAILAQWSITLSLIAALIIRIDQTDTNKKDGAFLGGILITINVIVFLLGAYSTVMSGIDDDDDDDDGDDNVADGDESSDEEGDEKEARKTEDKNELYGERNSAFAQDPDSDDDVEVSHHQYPDSAIIEMTNVQNPMLESSERKSPEPTAIAKIKLQQSYIDRRMPYEDPDSDDEI